MSNYFKTFPTVNYRFGNETTRARFQRLSQYSDLIDTFADQATAYIEYEIKEGERPDTLAYLLYEKPEYDFTFYLMNERLRETGWPMTINQLQDRAQNEFFKHYTCKLDVSTADEVAAFAGIYPVGQAVLVGGKNGVVVRKNLDVGEIVVSADSDLTGGTTLSYVSNFDASDPNQVGASLTNTVYEYEGTHHYENDSAEWLDKYFDDLSGATLKTNLDYLVDQNDLSKRIRIIKRENIDTLVGQLRRLLSET